MSVCSICARRDKTASHPTRCDAIGRDKILLHLLHWSSVPLWKAFCDASTRTSTRWSTGGTGGRAFHFAWNIHAEPERELVLMMLDQADKRLGWRGSNRASHVCVCVCVQSQGLSSEATVVATLKKAATKRLSDMTYYDDRRLVQTAVCLCVESASRLRERSSV